MENDKIPTLGLYGHRVVARTPDKIRGQYYSLVTISQCNFACPYCALFGDKKDGRGYLPNTINFCREEIKNFILDQLKDKNPIQITGGEPMCRADDVSWMVSLIHEKKGYASLATNGSIHKRMEDILPKLNQLCVDIKGTKETGAKISGIKNPRFYWDNPTGLLRMAQDYSCDIEVRTIIFDFTTYYELKEISRVVPKNAYWLIRSFSPFRNWSGNEVWDQKLFERWINGVPNEKLMELSYKLIDDEPSLENRLVVLTSSPSLKDEIGVIFRGSKNVA